MEDLKLSDNEFIQYLNSLLMEAAEKGYANIVRVLLKHGAEVNALINNVATPLYIAAQEGHADVVKTLLEYGVNTEIKASNGFTPLAMAVFNKHINVIKLLLQAGASTESTIEKGYTPIFVATIGNYFDGVKLLLESKANKNLVILDKTPVDIAKENNNENINMLLQGHNVEIKNQIDELLCTVSSYGDAAMAIQFLKQDANANAKCSYGMSPLEASIIGGHEGISNILISHGADVKTANDIAIKAFSLSAVKGDTLAVALALKNNPEILQKIDKDIILNSAANGHQDLIKILLSGLDVFCAQTDDVQFAEVCGKDNIEIFI